MAEDGEEDIPRAIDLLGVGRRGFGQGFVDGFVEADHVLEIGQLWRFQVIDPQADHASAQVAELGGHLYQVKANGMAQLAMAGGGFVQARGFFQAFALGLGRLFAGALAGVHVPRSGQQDGVRVVAQLRAVQGFGGRGQGFGKLFPFIDDPLGM